MARALVGDATPRAHTTLLAKDSRLALAMARTAGIDAPLGAVATATFSRAVEEGLGDRDDSRVGVAYEGEEVAEVIVMAVRDQG